MHLAPLIRDLAVILAVAAVVTVLFQRIKQPVVLGYLIAGLIVGPHTPPYPLVTDTPNINTLAEIGVIFLMFSLGLEFSFRKLVRVGLSAGLSAASEIVVMFFLGFGAGKLMGWSSADSVIMGTMLSMSSTTIIIKALDELGLKTRKFAELIFGILIVEDLVAILILVALSTFAAAGGFSPVVLATATGKLGLVVGCWVIAGYLLVPRAVRYVARFQSEETLTVVAIALCLSLVAFAAALNYSVALGAFIMGSILAESTESKHIENLVQPLRNVFAAIFFVSVGMLLDPKSMWDHKWAILLITAVTIVGKILSTGFGALLSGQTLKTSVMVGFGLAQIGEFSFIIAGLGLSLGIMSDFLYPVVVAVSLITTFTTPYSIKFAEKFASGLEDRLPEGARRFLARYMAWREYQSSKRFFEPEFNRVVLRWLLNGFVVTAIWTLIAQAGTPLLLKQGLEPAWAITASWVAALVFSAPFIWAIVTVLKAGASAAVSSGEAAKSRHAAAMLGMQVSTLLWFGVMSLAYFPAIYVGVATILVGGLLFRKRYRQLERAYGWFSAGMAEVMHPAGKEDESSRLMKGFAPWDGHLVRIRIHPDSEFSGQRIQDAELRKNFGINIVAIQRGSRTIVAPEPKQQLFPNDEVLVLGTDEQVEAIRHRFEQSYRSEPATESIGGYELRRVHIGAASPFLGISIRQSGIRERYGALVVGIERRGRRIRNPDSDVVMEIEDQLWLVGESTRLNELIAAV